MCKDEEKQVTQEEMEHQVDAMMKVYDGALQFIKENIATEDTPDDVPAYMMACHAMTEYLSMHDYHPGALESLEKALYGAVEQHLDANPQTLIDPSLN
tara:strand:+ start:2175 stop:2468 length:294 start_codon:yes stop_codon:yes gene_type:complete